MVHPVDRRRRAGERQAGRMGLYLLLGTLLLALVLLAFGNRIATSLLNQHLAGFLSDQLGLPVTIAPISAQLLKLEATTSRLVMGPQDAPAIDARGVRLRLDRSALLSGRIQFSHVEADDLTVAVSRWPGSGNPLPENYHFLDPWLPATLELKQGRYLPANDKPWELQALSVQRDQGRAMIFQWSEARPAGTLTARLELQSLDELLAMERTRLQLDVSGEPLPADTFSLTLDIQPHGDKAYKLNAVVQSESLQGRFNMIGDAAWDLSGRSQIDVSSLRPAQASGLLEALLHQREDRKLEDQLASPLPHWALPDHVAELSIGKILLDDEVLLQNGATISAQADQLKISNWSGLGPAGKLQASARFDRLEKGWEIKLNADLTARSSDAGLANMFVGADWFWQEGLIRLSTRGDSLGELLGAVEGEAGVSGYHLGRVKTPIQLSAGIQGDSTSIAADSLRGNLGSSTVSGSMTAVMGERLRFTAKLDSPRMDLGFLVDDGDASAEPGAPVPVYLGVLPGIDFDIQLQAEELLLPQLAIRTFKVGYSRDGAVAKLRGSARGMDKGQLNISLDALSETDGDDTELKAVVVLDDVDLQALFKQTVSPLNSRTSGRLDLTSNGSAINEIFSQLRGETDLTVEFDAEGYGKRSTDFKGDAGLIMNGDRILGVEISGLEIGSIHQDVTGDVSLVASRSPWIIAELKAERLDLDRLGDWVPPSPQEADEADILRTLRDAGPIRVSLQAKTLSWQDNHLDQVLVELESGEDSFAVNRLDFSMPYGRIASKLGLQWQGEQATLDASAQLTELHLDHFAGHLQPAEKLPMRGSLTLNSRGASASALAANLQGQLNAKTDILDSSGSRPRRSVDLAFSRLVDGTDMDVRLQWDQSQLNGDVRLHGSTPPRYEIKIYGGSVDLRPWEAQMDTESPQPTKDSGGIIITARNTGKVVGNILSSPLRLLRDSEQQTRKPEDDFFSAEPLPLDILQEFNGTMDLKLDQVLSEAGTAKGLQIKASLENGRLDVAQLRGEVNGGRVQASGFYDWGSPERPAALDAEVDDFQSTPSQPTAPRSGFISMKSKGSSEAELARNADGQIFLTLGRGPLDYSGLSFITTDLTTKIFGILIPGSERRVPELRCAVALGTVRDGKAVTPYGYVAQTRQANLVGRMAIDLEQQTLRMEFDSRSRRGVGINVGNVFSNAITVQGPISSPSIVPRTTSLLWRGWAAVMTGGLSIIGESLVKRALSAKDPCSDILKEIRDKECGTDSPAARSPRVCPVNTGQEQAVSSRTTPPVAPRGPRPA